MESALYDSDLASVLDRHRHAMPAREQQSEDGHIGRKSFIPVLAAQLLPLGGVLRHQPMIDAQRK